MMKKIGLAGVLVCALSFLGVMGTDRVFADQCGKTTYNPSAGQICCAPGTVQGGENGKVLSGGSLAKCNVKDDDSLMPTMNKVINVVVGFVGIISVAMMVIGGILIATSQGDTSKVSKGKNTMIFGIAGLIICVLAFAIVNFVLKGVFGS